MQRVVQEEERKVESAWFRNVNPSTCNVDIVLTKLMENSLRERSSVIEGMVNLAFILLGEKAAKGRETSAEKLWRLGISVLVKLVKKHNKVTGCVLQRLTDCIISDQAVTQYTDCLHQLSMSVPLVLNEYRSSIITLLEMLTQLPGPVAENVVYAVLPIVRSFPSLRDVLIMVLRKALFARNVGTRKMAVSGFLQLLKHLDVKGLAVLSSSQSSYHSSNPRQSPGPSLLTQIDMETGNSSSNNEAICLELLGVLRRCFMQQADVRLRLYEGLHSGVTRNPELREYVQDMLINHFGQFYESDTDTLPPINFTKAVVLKDISVELLEPLGHLVFSLQQVATPNSSDSSPTKIISVLESLCLRMLKCSLEDFGLDETTNLLDVVPESQQKQEIVCQILGVFEALMGYTVSSCTVDTSAEKVRKLNGLFKGYRMLAEFAKNNGKAGKKTSRDSDTQPKKMDVGKKATGKGRTVAFMFPHTVLDCHVTYKMLCILYMNSVPWCTAEAANCVKGRHEFSSYVMNTTLKLVKASQDEKRRKKSTSMLTSFVNIGRLLYTNCVIRLREFSQLHVGTAALALECFNELFSLMCSHYEDKLEQFLEEVGTVPVREGLTEQLLALVSKYEENLTSVLSEAGDDEDDPLAKKIPLLLIQGLGLFTLKIPCNDASTTVLNWVKTFVKDKVLSDVYLVKAILSLLFKLEVRCKGSSQLFDHITMQLFEIMGTVDEDEEVQEHTSYCIVRAGCESAVLSQLCDTVSQMLKHVDWVLSRLQAEYTAMTHAVSDTLQAKREILKSRECDVVHQVSHCLKILNYMSSLALDPGPTTDAVLKLLTQQYINLTMLTKYFILRSNKGNPAFQNARFEMVVRLAGKHLSPHVYNLISYIEANQKKNKKNGIKKKKAGPLLIKSKVLRETRFIPNLIFEIEQFEKLVIELSKKSKVNLMNYVKLGTYRDFRIHSNRLHTTDDEDQNVSNASDAVVDGVEAQGKGCADDSVVKEPPRKKARKQ
ncbi:Fanconi anemia group I protein [Zootermopsis nevadensis]|uniref:Fanconi anemia group I protein n=2 Tax=Zootermopsis nevadensis TaxID=136037 RepID=A0A067QJ24_ZOONE|nr:Fanconi anemia group I protein [Zootermopsis nevadensis]